MEQDLMVRARARAGEWAGNPARGRRVAIGRAQAPEAYAGAPVAARRLTTSRAFPAIR